MPPKQQASKKAVDKQKQKIIEDKTFGLKNKNKSKKVAQYVSGVENQVKGPKVPTFQNDFFFNVSSRKRAKLLKKK